MWLLILIVALVMVGIFHATFGSAMLDLIIFFGALIVLSLLGGLVKLIYKYLKENV